MQIDSYISFNGQHVVYKGKTIYENPLKQSELSKLHQAVNAYDYPMVFISDTEMRATTENHPYIWETHRLLTTEYPKIDTSYYLNNRIFQALLYCVEDEHRIFETNHHHFYFQRWHKYSCDIIPSGGSKAIGIDKVLAASGVKKEYTYAFGDGINDIEMIEASGTGIAMGNSINELKQIADYVTGDVDQEGVMQALLKYKLL